MNIQAHLHEKNKQTYIIQHYFIIMTCKWLYDMLFMMCDNKDGSYLIPHDHQFGLKAKYSTDMCIFTVKTLVKYYTDQNTPVYTCLPDANKVFDRVNHWPLFAKLKVLESNLKLF